jgi:hypothetical protein
MPAPQIKDGCVFVRDAYNGFLNLCGSNRWVSTFMFGGPVYWFMGCIIYYSKIWGDGNYRNTVASPAYTILAILMFSWCLAIFSVFRFWPNLLSISIFIHESFGHWCLVSLMMLWYISNQSISITAELMKMYFALIALPILLLLIGAEILRTHRSKMFSHNVSQDRMIERPGSANGQVPSEL